MNYWTQLSIDLANQQNYLDLLFRVYPTIPEDCRDIKEDLWEKITRAYTNKEHIHLMEYMLQMKLFPVKDSYVAYLRRDKSAIERNPETVRRLVGRMYEMGLDKLYEKCSEPKETNRQIGPLFKKWIKSGVLGYEPISYNDFISTKSNAILDGTDLEMKRFANEHLGYTLEKGLDFVARFNGKYIIGEAKFLSDQGGNQNNQLQEAMNILHTSCNAVKIAILDGVCYIKGKNKLYRQMIEENDNIMSALVLREFLYQL